MTTPTPRLCTYRAAGYDDSGVFTQEYEYVATLDTPQPPLFLAAERTESPNPDHGNANASKGTCADELIQGEVA